MNLPARMDATLTQPGVTPAGRSGAAGLSMPCSSRNSFLGSSSVWPGPARERGSPAARSFACAVARAFARTTGVVGEKGVYLRPQDRYTPLKARRS